MKSNSEYTLREHNTNKASIIEESSYCQDTIPTLFVLSIEVEQGRIQAIRIIANPEKLTRV